MLEHRMNFADWFWTEDKTRNLKPHQGKDKENYVQGMQRELGINPNSIPDFIESGPVELPDEGLVFNQAVWQVVKPIDANDEYVRIKFHKSLSPNLNQHCYVKQHDGQLMPVNGDISNKVFVITLDKLSEMLGRGWAPAMQQQAGGGQPM